MFLIDCPYCGRRFVLTGGASYCSAPRAPDVYGRFDEFYNTYEVVRQLLGGE